MTDLTTALKRLAEKYPDIFLIGKRDDEPKFVWEMIEKRRYGSNYFDALTQDDLDEIAALVGWEYWVLPEFYLEEYAGVGSAEPWRCYIRQIGDYGPILIETQEFHDTKLEAAKSALIAIVEQVTK